MRLKYSYAVLLLIGLFGSETTSGFTLMHPQTSSTAVLPLRRAFIDSHQLHATKKEGPNDGERKKSGKSSPKKKRKYYSPKSKKQQSKNKEQKKQAVGKAVQALRNKGKPDKQTKKEQEKENLLDIVNPFKAGRKLRKTIESLTGGLSPEKRSVYYLDDRFQEQGPLFSERNPSLDRLDRGTFVPEVLVVGATGEVGRLVVRRLLLDGRFKVRVLVRDLFSKTLNLLGTGVTYCQGDLANVESVEYAVTDVDKIVFCAAPPRPDEADFQDKFQAFCKDNMAEDDASVVPPEDKTATDLEWEQLESVLDLRAKLAEQIDGIGMQNLVRAYQNVRFADYGTSQTAKRSLFKFQSRPEDFSLFAIDEDDQEVDESLKMEEKVTAATKPAKEKVASGYDSPYDAAYDEYEQDYDEYADDYTDDYADEYAAEDQEMEAESRKGASTKAQCLWMRNKFGHAVFVGRVSKGSGGVGGEAAVVSSRLRSREDPENGIDLGSGFGGFVVRHCADGGRYEAFVRTGNYETDGIEYVCEFETGTKLQQRGNKSRNKFSTSRLSFENFKPIQRKGTAGSGQSVPLFRGKDVRQIGFRYRSDSNKERNKLEKGDYSSFYLALSYIKMYRSQPEPEFIYLSDARIPPKVETTMVRDDLHQLVTTVDDDSESFQLLDDAKLQQVAQDKQSRSSEETYYKFKGEETLRNSGLNYAIIRVCGYNEATSGEASTIELKKNQQDVGAVSRADVAQVCASALLDPNALNKSFYMSKTKETTKNLSVDEDISLKFAELPMDS